MDSSRLSPLPPLPWETDGAGATGGWPTSEESVLGATGGSPTSAASAPRPFVPWHKEQTLSRLRDTLRQWEEQGKEALSRNPLESLLALVFGGAVFYYLAERRTNSRVNTYWDALEYVSTCASVGYSNIFPETPLGKIVASTLFLVGPTLTAQALEPAQGVGSAVRTNPAADDQALVQRLDAILAELRALRVARGS